MTLSAAQRITIAQQRPRQVPTVKLHELKLLQVWQPWRLADVIDVCQAYGFTGLLVKALDGSLWMERYDPSSDAVGSLDELRRQADLTHQAGLYYFAWTNPLQNTANDMAHQATLSGQVAKACDGVFLDVEPYHQFFGVAPPGVPRQFMQWLRAEAPDAFVVLQPDPRPARLGEIRSWEWLDYCDAFSGQHYWSDFRSDPKREMAYAAELGEVYDMPWLPTLPGNAPLNSFPVSAIAEAPGFVVWRYGSTPPATLDMLGRVSVGGFTSARIHAPGG